MEEFEKWYNEYTARVEPGIDYLDAQTGYKAALEHAVHKLKTNVNGFFELVKELESFGK